MEKHEAEFKEAFEWLVNEAIDKGYFDDFQSDFMAEHEEEFEKDADGYFTDNAYESFWKMVNEYKVKFFNKENDND